MNKLRILLTGFLLMTFAVTVSAQAKKTTVTKKKVAKTTVKKVIATPKQAKLTGTRVRIKTDMGDMIVLLYDRTPKHRDNFIKLANEHFFDSLLFHRVIQGFMIQGGDPSSKHAEAGAMLGSGDIGYLIPAEFDTALFHKKGALAAARTGNPEKASSGCQFYIVQGRPYSDEELNNMEMQMGRKFSPAKRQVYKTLGGTPFLDMEYTVFGELESGWDVIDKIAAVQKGPADRPLTDVHMYIEVLK